MHNSHYSTSSAIAQYNTPHNTSSRYEKYQSKNFFKSYLFSIIIRIVLITIILVLAFASHTLVFASSTNTHDLVDQAMIFENPDMNLRKQKAIEYHKTTHCVSEIRYILRHSSTF